MPIYRPSELGKYLEELGVHPKKRLSQNFLLDRNILRKIVALADLKPNDVVIEIGPGPGALTEALLETGAKVLAVEKDAVLAASLEKLQSESNNLQIYCDDILTFSIEEEVSRHL
ncbi:MAG: ribosomal RNA small subunit methyltransferase A, partial [Waddliaceae bacterium]